MSAFKTFDISVADSLGVLAPLIFAKIEIKPDVTLNTPSIFHGTDTVAYRASSSDFCNDPQHYQHTKYRN